MRCCGREAKREAEADEIEDLEEQKASLLQMCQGLPHNLAEAERRIQALLAERQQAEDALQMKQAQVAKVEAYIHKQGGILATARDSGAFATFQNDSALFSGVSPEAEVLRFYLEPERPRILIEAWAAFMDDEQSKPRAVFLGEQWLPDEADLRVAVASALAQGGPARQKLWLQPATLLSRQAKGKPLVAVELDPFPEGVRLEFQAEERLPPSDRAQLRPGAEGPMSLKGFSLVCEQGESKAPTAVKLCFWLWGKDRLSGDGRNTAERPPEAALWLEVLSSSSFLDEHLLSLPIEERSIILATEISENMVLSRTNPLLRALLPERVDLIDAVLRLQKSGPETYLVENLSELSIIVDGCILQKGVPMTVRIGQIFSFGTSRERASDVAVEKDQVFVPFLTTRLSAPAQASLPSPRPSREGEEEGLLLERVQGLELCPQQQQSHACTDTGVCSGGTGDPLFLIKPSSRAHSKPHGASLPPVQPGVYCVGCCLELSAEYKEMVEVQPNNSKVMPPTWTLFRESPASPVRRPAGGDPGDSWRANFGRLSVVVPAFASCTEAITRKVTRARGLEAAKAATTAAAERALLTEELAKLRSDAADLQRDLEQLKSQGLRLASAEGFAEGMGSLEDTVETLRRQSKNLRSRLEAAAKQSTVEHSAAEKLVAAAEATAANARPPVEICHAASILEPPTSNLQLANHRRFLRTCNELQGLLFRDSWLDVHVLVHRPECLLEDHQFLVPGGLVFQRAPAASLKARVDLKFQVRAGSSDQSHPSGTYFKTFDAQCMNVDLMAAHCEAATPSVIESLPEKTVERSFTLELTEILCTPLSLQIVATTASSGQPITEHRSSVMLPVLITTFLEPLPPDLDYMQAWKDWPLQAAGPVLVPTPMGTGQLLTPMAALRGLNGTSGRIILGGAMSLYEQPGGAALIGAELRAHGCLEDCVVLLSITQAMNTLVPTWELSAKSQELRLAEAVAAALGSHLRAIATQK